MTRIEIPDGFGCDALPNGEWVSILQHDDSQVLTHLGPIPTTAGIKPGYPRCSNVGGFKFAGQANRANLGPLVKYEHGGWLFASDVPCGVSPVIYDLAGVLHVSDCSIGSQGWRYVDPVTGALVTGDQTYSSQQANPPFEGLAEWTDLGGGLYVGSCNVTPGCALFNRADGKLRLIEAGPVQFIRARRDGDAVSLAMIKQQGQPSVILWTTVAELLALPVLGTTAPALPAIAPLPGKAVCPFKDDKNETDAPYEIVVNGAAPKSSRPRFCASDPASMAFCCSGVTTGRTWIACSWRTYARGTSQPSKATGCLARRRSPRPNAAARIWTLCSTCGTATSRSSRPITTWAASAPQKPGRRLRRWRCC